MTAVQLPRLAEVFPGLATEVTELLVDEDARLARTIQDLRFYGRCTCTPTCPVLLTAPVGSPSPGIIVLERDGETIALLNFDPEQRSVTGIEVLDGRDLSVPSA
ncbi:hypothetical protein D7D52_20995 [Nocardia yunnanensis]|uniref:Uncharacterized protein n=1 Tax=Nocardia yunnanensis TaxID=2382165 RepID=A0A386ZEF2_9NOCA|nr:hypothetical protein [Nocardia yunnanensis]AYF75906.1 hypothetical protein D7D52_20995 [Nocardia yunnanensis]